MTTSLPPTKQHTLTLRAFNNSRLIKYTHLHRLYFIGCLNSTIFDDQDFARFCRALSTLKSLTVLDINLSWTKQLHDRHFFELASALKKLQDLTILRLNFRDSYHKDGHGIVGLFEALERHRSLKELHLDFATCAHPSPKLAELIFSSLRKMNRLESIHLIYFALTQKYGNYHRLIADNDAESVETLSKFKRCYQIKNLVLDFSKARGVSDLNIKALSGIILHMPRLSKVSLNFRNEIHFPNAHFEILARSLKRLSQLRNLHLALPDKTTQEASINLSQIASKAFENSQVLSSLTLDFSKHNSIVTQSLFLALGTLPNLSKLNLNFNSCSYLNDESFKLLASSIANLNNLASLKLSFLRTQFLSRISLATISDALKDLSSLQELELGFNASDVYLGLPALYGTLNSLAKQLSRLSLEFSQSKEFGDKDLKDLAQVLKGCDQLVFLRLGFFGTAVGDQGIQELACQVQSMKKLEQLSGNFFGCKEITATGIENFQGCFALNKSIKELNLVFPETSQGVKQEKAQEGKQAKHKRCSIF